jgi:predicted metal-dependent hydrolase
MAVDRVGQAIQLFNRRDFFAAHEVLEEVWRCCSDEEKRLVYEAIIRIAAALHLRFHRGAHRGSIRLLQQALLRLEDIRPVCAEIDTAGLYEEVSAYLERLRAEPGPVTLFERFRLPKVRHATATAST